MLDISTFILTYNEERHIARCIENAQRYAKKVYVVDSFSKDRTVDIARALGAEIYQNAWVSHSHQTNWALQNLPIDTEWVWRQDADEYLTDELIAELEVVIPTTPQGINAYTAPCLRKFMGKEIKHGILPLILLRLFRFKYGKCEERLMDEHIEITDGIIGRLKHAFYDDSLMTLSEWTQKHNGYSDKEAIDLLMTEYRLMQGGVNLNMGEHSVDIRKKKLKYIKLPLFWRAFGFFVLRYIFRGGFLDGKEGFLWHFLQGFWYRSLADAKVFEIKKRFNYNEEAIKNYLKDNYLTNINRGGVNCKVLPLINSIGIYTEGRYAYVA